MTGVDALQRTPRKSPLSDAAGAASSVMSSLRVAIAQINCSVGDLAGNAERILDAAARAHADGADLLLTPELALVRLSAGRPAAAARISTAPASGNWRRWPPPRPCPWLSAIPRRSAGRRYNAASLLRDGRVAYTYRKQRLPNSEVFDEERYFDTGDAPGVIDVAAVRVGLAICEDVWEPGAAEAARAAGAELLLALNASPFHMNKQARATRCCASASPGPACRSIYANLVGGQDELVFDGASFALDCGGRLTHQLPAFAEEIGIVEYAAGHLLPGACRRSLSAEAEVYAALKSGRARLPRQERFSRRHHRPLRAASIRR